MCLIEWLEIETNMEFIIVGCRSVTCAIDAHDE